MMVNAWKLHGEASRVPAWTNVQNKVETYSKGFSVSKSAPFGVDDGPTNYSTNLRPGTAASKFQAQGMPTAGSSSWAQRNETTITGAPKGQNPQKDMSYSDRQLVEVFA
jgi:hypothetical protein